MSVLRHSGLTIAAALAAALSGQAAAQAFPNRPIHVFVPAGSSSDVIMRVLGQSVSASVGQPIVIENRAPIQNDEVVAKAKPDGYTLNFGSASAWLRALVTKISWDANSYAAVGQMVTQPSVVAVSPALPAKTIKELVALAKARPGALNYGSSGVGSAQYLGMELLNSKAGINVTHVPFKTAGQAVNDLLAGRVDVLVTVISTVSGFAQSGKLRLLAVTSATPYVRTPDLPTVAASGVPGYQFDAAAGLLAPRGTPVAIISKLNQEYNKAITVPDIREKVEATGVDVAVGTPELFGERIRSDVATWTRLFKELNITPEDQ